MIENEIGDFDKDGFGDAASESDFGVPRVNFGGCYVNL